MAFNPNFTALKEQYQERIDWLINTAGKSIILYFEKEFISSEPDQSIVDEVRGDIIKEPFYKPNSQTEEYDTSTIKALVKYNPTDFKRFNIKIDDSQNVVRLKTFMTNVPSLLKAKFIVVSETSKDYVYAKFRLLREPTIHGLQDDRYCISFWERII